MTPLHVTQHSSSFPGRSTRRLPHKPRAGLPRPCDPLPLGRRLSICLLPEGTDKSYAMSRVSRKTHVLDVSPPRPYHRPSLHLASPGHPTDVNVADCAVTGGDHPQPITAIRQEKKVDSHPVESVITVSLERQNIRSRPEACRCTR